MKSNRSHIFRVLSFAAALIFLGGCGNKIEYPEGADTLPTYSDTGSVITVYDTSARTTPPETLPTTSQTTTVTETVTTVPESTSETETVTETVPSQSETSESTVGSLSLEDIPDVGISEYYEKTQTTPTFPAFFTSAAQSSSQVSLTSASSESSISSDTSALAGTADVTATASEPSVEANPETSSQFHVKLSDGRKSKYTGRDIISHPYSYYTLDKKHQDLYDRLVTAMLDCEDRITFSSGDNINFDDLFDTYQLIYNDENKLFYISPTIEYVSDSSTGNIRSMRLQYNFSKDSIASMQAEIDAEADKILSMITPEMNDYDIVKLFHDYIIKNCTYNDKSENPNNIYGTLVQKNSLCQGYSQSFTYLCSLAGIDSFIVLGVANEPHMWNVVKMDGDYYHVDLTWDDPDKSGFPDSVRYDYFGLTDDRIRELRQFDDYDYEIPKATGTKYQYYSYNGLVASSVDEAKRLISSETLKASEIKASTVQIMCSDDKVFGEVTDLFFGNSTDNIIGILDSVKSEAKNSYNTASIHHNSNKSTRTVKIFLEYLD